MENSYLRFSQFLKEEIAPILRFLLGQIGGWFAFGGLGLIGYQVFIWLKSGEWQEFSLLTTIRFIERKLIPNFIGKSGPLHDLLGWLWNPQDWFGVNKILISFLEFIPLSAFLLIFGILLVILEQLLRDWSKEFQ